MRTNLISKFKPIAQCALLVGVGCLQLTGDLLGNDTLKGLGAITHASPAPKVFTAHKGYETYSPKFLISAVHSHGAETQIQLTPQINARVRGPYNRRNAFGAAISYGPVLADDPATRPMFEAAFRYGLCHSPGLVEEIELPRVNQYRVNVVTRDNNAQWPTTFSVNCQTGVVSVGQWTQSATGSNQVTNQSTNQTEEA